MAAKKTNLRIALQTYKATGSHQLAFAIMLKQNFGIDGQRGLDIIEAFGLLSKNMKLVDETLENKANG